MVLEQAEQITVRMPKDLLRRIDEAAKVFVSPQAGTRITRADAVRILVTEALEHRKVR